MFHERKELYPLVCNERQSFDKSSGMLSGRTMQMSCQQESLLRVGAHGLRVIRLCHLYYVSLFSFSSFVCIEIIENNTSVHCSASASISPYTD